ncbi:helix-turn-helix domain-containing protein [Croceivirga thetidis]|uniref:AraC family transcriptional regulator n=1 Tax=Croceivirga thetidis TaxID=2721623 RepID=A0ABX1GMC2_9FLAO|nr:helix-turn-helix domain-containing protein [Croceivirga thetidis]NKI31067.1 AraC family transcriptional regulator [Croceivirga thetidis]
MDSSSVILVLSCLGIAQALFLCFYLFTLKKGNRAAHLFLGLIILGLTIRIGKSILNEYLFLVAWQRNLGIAGILLVGPSLWFYGKSLFKKKTKFSSQQLLHFVPYLFFSLFCWLIPNTNNTISLVIYYGVFVHLLVYCLLAIILMINQRNHPQKGVLIWFRNLVIGVSLIGLFYIGNVSGLIPFYIGGAICYTFLIYIFSFLLLKKHSFQLEKYQGQSLDVNTTSKLMQSITELFEKESVYLNPKISLGDVATSVGTTTKVLSRVINESTGKNFSEYVNSYRIEKAKKLLVASETKAEKIVSIAYDSGFNNVTTFNLAFKANTQLTPSQYREQMG